MNHIPVLKSKLTRPELSESFLLTDRLKNLHKNMDSCRAVNICAPAGYGKTTLAVSYFNRQEALPFRVCWYRLDPEDKNLSVFIAHLLETIFPSDSALFTESRKTIENYTDIQFQTHDIISMICREMWEHLGNTGNNRTYIVLDDFQNVAQIEDICHIIRYLLDNLPPSYTIFILNRSNLSIFTEKQKLEKKILEIDMFDLSFSNAEIRDLLQSTGQTAVDRKLAETIEKNTEGWIAGIVILCQAIKSKGSGASIESGRLWHEDALFRYMSMEVFKSVERHTRDRLVRLALLQDFSENEAAVILEIDDIKSLLEQCMSFGMFIQRIPGASIVYRFHSLFREFLLTILKESFPEHKLSELHLKAARYYMNHAAYGRAAGHLIKCGNSALAMDMVSKAGFNKFMIGEAGQLKLWLDLLPEDMIRSNPVLLLFKAQLMPNSRQPEMVDTLKEVLQLSLLNNDLAVYYDAATVLIYIFMCSNNMKGLLEMTEDFIKQSRNVSAELKNTLIILDMVHSIGEEQFLTAEEQSESIQYSLLPEDSQWLYLILSCIVYYCLGKLDYAERCMKTALVLNNFKNIEPSRGFILLFLSIVLSLKNEIESLPSHISEVLAIGEKYNYEYLSAHGRRLSAFERYLSFDREASAVMLDQAILHFRQINNKAMASACKLLRLLWSIQPGSPVPDLDEARKELAVIEESGPGLLVHEISLSVLGAISRESGDFKLAEYCLLSAVKSAKEKKGRQVLCGSCFHLARLYYSAGDMEQGNFYLKQAIESAAGNRYFMFWDIHIPTLVDMALRSIRYGYCSGYAQELLHKFYNGKAVKYLIEKVKIIDENRITAFTENFIFTYKKEHQSEPLYLVKASLFGKPEISVNGVKIPDTEWKTKKVKGFLEYLLLCSGNTVSKELLAEIFWSDSDSRSAVASQRTALYYLRKILNKYNIDVTGNNAFIYETPEGLQIRNNDALELDIHEFLRLHDEFTMHKKNAYQSENASILERMLSVYKGDLMEGSDYGDLVFLEREKFKSIFMTACQELSSIYISNGNFQKAEEILRRTLAYEPYDESICLKLLNLYISQGKKSRASKVYYSFKKRLEQELGIKIDHRLTEVLQNSGMEKPG